MTQVKEEVRPYILHTQKCVAVGEVHGRLSSNSCIILHPHEECKKTNLSHSGRWGLIWISLMTNDVEHCFVHIFFCSVSIQEITSCFLNWGFFFILLSFKCSLHIVGMSPISDMCIASIFLIVSGLSFHAYSVLFWRAGFSSWQRVIFHFFKFSAFVC